MFDGLDTIFKAFFWMLFLAVPLATWKVIEIVVWLFKHVSFQ